MELYRTGVVCVSWDCLRDCAVIDGEKSCVVFVGRIEDIRSSSAQYRVTLLHRQTTLPFFFLGQCFAHKMGVPSCW
jgi:hypothetical protein